MVVFVCLCKVFVAFVSGARASGGGGFVRAKVLVLVLFWLFGIGVA